MNTTIKGPIKYHGGNFYKQKFLHANAPPSHVSDPAGYTHLVIHCAGGAQEAMNWPDWDRLSECWNDINYGVWNFYWVLRNNFESFLREVELMPFGESSFKYSSKIPPTSEDKEIMCVRAAAQFFIRCRMSRQGCGKTYSTPTRRLRRDMNEHVSSWLSAVDGLEDVHNRLRSVELINQPLLETLRKRDHPKALHHLDPPFVKIDEDGRAIRSPGVEYASEMTLEDHEDMLKALSSVTGKFMLQGYDNLLYERYREENGWRKIETQYDKKSSSKKTKEIVTECLWMNY